MNTRILIALLFSTNMLVASQMERKYAIEKKHAKEELLNCNDCSTVKFGDCKACAEKGCCKELTKFFADKKQENCDKVLGLQFIAAAKNGDSTVLAALLKQNKNLISYKDSTNNHALECASEHGHGSAVDVLLEHGSSPYLEGENHEYAVEKALRKGFTQIATTLLAWGEYEKTDRNRFLQGAIKAGQLESVRLMLKLRAGIEDMVGLSGFRPMHEAAWYNKPKVLDLLLDRNAELEPTNNKGQTPFMCAVNKDSVEAMIFLKSKGANINCKDGDGLTPILSAAQYGKNKALPHLLLWGSDAHFNVNYDGAAVSRAFEAENSNLTAIKSLMRYGFNANGSFPFSLGRKLKKHQMDYLKCLLDHGLDIHKPLFRESRSDNGGIDLLRYAVGIQQPELVALCLSQDYHQETIRKIAQNNLSLKDTENNDEISELLSQYKLRNRKEYKQKCVEEAQRVFKLLASSSSNSQSNKVAWGSDIDNLIVGYLDDTIATSQKDDFARALSAIQCHNKETLQTIVWPSKDVLNKNVLIALDTQGYCVEDSQKYTLLEHAVLWNRPAMVALIVKGLDKLTAVERNAVLQHMHRGFTAYDMAKKNNNPYIIAALKPYYEKKDKNIVTQD